MKRIALVFAAIVLIGFAVFVFVLAGRNPTLQVQVVDSRGVPIGGAIVTPDGIRGTDGGHYGWAYTDVSKSKNRKEPTRTDTNGRAAISYPTFITERVRSIEVSFGVEHPDFCPERPFLKVSSPITSKTPFRQWIEFMWQDLRHGGKVQKVVLNSGAVLEVSGTLNGTRIPTSVLHAQVTSADGVVPERFFRQSDGKIYSRQLPAGPFMVRAVRLTSDDAPKFSNLLEANSIPGATNRFSFELKPGHRVRGTLTTIPSSVTNGWINARVFNNGASGGQELLSWADFAKINSDGTFVIESLPSGRLELVAICDGFLSKNPREGAGFVLPLTWDLKNDLDVTIPMQESAVADIRLIDPAGRPLPNINVEFWPNIRWADYWSTIFASDFYSSPDVLQKGEYSAQQKRFFQAKTDQNGRALIKELPPFTLPVAVGDAAFELPLEENAHQATISLRSGATNFTSLKLQKKGKQFRE
jgi:hypothetical protein